MKNFISKVIVPMAIMLLIGACSENIFEENAQYTTTVSRSTDVDTDFDSASYLDYYWVGDEKVPLQQIEGKYMIMYDCSENGSLSGSLSTSDIQILEIEAYEPNSHIDSQKADIYANMEKAVVEGKSEALAPLLSDAFYSVPLYRMENGNEVEIDNWFYVALKSEKDYGLLEEFARKNSVEILGKVDFLEGWYYMGCTNQSKGNALQMANLFQESGLFESASPSVSGAGNLTDINEPLFKSGKLWHLNNINYCNSRDILSKGSSDVIVAVVDAGVDFSHRDFYNVLPGWDAAAQKSPNYPCGSHGTMVAGFIGAIPNNSQDVAGVAYGTTILPISFRVNFFGQILSNQDVLARGINYAVAQGAKVINCSWGYNHSVVVKAIKNALDAGCIVVFAAGNSSGRIGVPANSDPRIIVVGAVDKAGRRADFSNYGDELDIVAPGVDVYSLCPGNTTGVGSGTSYAAPQVAGLVAMILSKHPKATLYEVNYHLMKTASKCGSYNYAYNRSDTKDFGSWNNEVGHGLIDMWAALSSELPVAPTTYPITVIIRNSSDYMPGIFFRFDISNTSYQELTDIEMDNKSGMIAVGEELVVHFNLPPGKYIGEVFPESAGFEESECEFEITDRGATITYELIGSTRATLDWNTPKFEPAR